MDKLIKPNHLSPSRHSFYVSICGILFVLSLGLLAGAATMQIAIDNDIEATVKKLQNLKLVKVAPVADYSYLLWEQIQEEPTENKKLLLDSKWLCTVTDCGYIRSHRTKMNSLVWKQYDAIKDKWFRISDPSEKITNEVWELKYTIKGHSEIRYKIFSEKFFCWQNKMYLEQYYEEEYTNISDCTKSIVLNNL